MNTINLIAGWVGIYLGFLSGAIQGVFFHRDNWLGGYSTWPRRITRLGHISFFGIGFVNLFYAATIHIFGIDNDPITSTLLIIGAISMPTVCYVSAFRKPFRHMFFVPVLSPIGGVGWFINEGGEECVVGEPI